VWGEIWFAWDAWVFGGEMDEDLRRLIDEVWREVMGGSKLQVQACNG
jgi:hypothetical protein